MYNETNCLKWKVLFAVKSLSLKSRTLNSKLQRIPNSLLSVLLKFPTLSTSENRSRSKLKSTTAKLENS